MGRNTRRRAEEAVERESKVRARLLAHPSRAPVRADPVRPASELADGFEIPWELAIRPVEDWERRGRSRDADRQRLDLLRWCFSAYPVPKFLDRAWVRGQGPRTEAERRRAAAAARAAARRIDFTRWWIAAARGDSLHKTCTKGILSSKETHLFLHAPDALEPIEAVWWAAARGAGAGIGLAGRLVRTRLARMDPECPFWRSVLRFFVSEPPEDIATADWLMDYLAARRAEDPDYAMKGRTLSSVRRASEEWHRLQAKQAAFGKASWTPYPIEDGEYRFGKDERTIVWRVRQITTGRELVEEGHAQRHCVGSYQSSCVRGACAIFSMTRTDAAGNTKRALTIEISDDFRVAQARGHGNRSADPEEASVLSKWAAENGLAGGGRGG